MTLAPLLLAACGLGDDAGRSEALLLDCPTLPAVVRTFKALLRKLLSALQDQLETAAWSRRVRATLCQEFGT